jgi:hypothetical protein
MDLRAYYRKVRETEATLPSPHVVVVSLATPDGGKPGVPTEVSTSIGARMLVEGSAREATTEESAAFRERNEREMKASEDAAVASKLQVVVIPATPASRTPSPRPGKTE